jgi:hypothetical protein
MVARIEGKVSEEMLRGAVAKAQQRHALLNVRIKDDDEHAQWFTSEGVQAIPIEIVPRESENDWIKIHAEASRIPFEFERRPAIRFILVQSQATSDLIILCHHIICDGMSLAYLARDLMVFLGDPARKVEVLPAPPTLNLDNLPPDVAQSGVVKTLINRMNRKWAEERVFFDSESEMETSALVDRCREENITVNSALTAAFSGAQSVVEGEKPYHAKVVVGTNLRDRIPNSTGEGMGMYAGAVELKFKYNDKKSFWENARKFHKKIQPKFTNKNLFGDILNWLYLDPSMFEAMNFKKLGGLVTSESIRYEKLSDFSKQEDVVLRLLQRDKIESLEKKHWGAAITNLGRLEFPRTYGSLKLDRLSPLVNVNLVVGAVTCSGKLSLVVEYAEEAIDSSTIEKIKDKAMELLFLVGI